MPPERTIGFEIRPLNNLIKRDVESSKAFELGRATGLHGWAIGYFRLRYLEKNLDVHIFCRGHLLKPGEGKRPNGRVYDKSANNIG